MTNLKVRKPPGTTVQDINGKLISLFNAIVEVAQKRRRGSYIFHFFRERLDKKERRDLLILLGQFIQQLQRETKGSKENQKTASHGASLPPEVKKLLIEYRKCISKTATFSRQRS